MAVYYRSDEAIITVTVLGFVLPTTVPWDKLEGGELKSEGLVVHPGGQLNQVALGGIQKREPVKVSVKWQDNYIAVWKVLDEQVGRALATMTYQVVNQNYTPVSGTGYTVTYEGVLSEVVRPNYEAGKSEEALLVVAMDCNGAIK